MIKLYPNCWGETSKIWHGLRWFEGSGERVSAKKEGVGKKVNSFSFAFCVVSLAIVAVPCIEGIDDQSLFLCRLLTSLKNA